jgi:phosphate transport system permease protein
VKLSLKPKAISYLQNHSFRSILATGLIVLAAIGIASIGIAEIFDILGTWLATDFTGIHVSFYGVAFNKMVASLLLSTLQTMLCLPLFIIAYFVSEAHPYGNKLSLILSFVLVTIAFLASYRFEVMLTTGALCAIAGFIEPVKQQKKDQKVDSPVVIEKIVKFGLKFSGLLVIIILFGIIAYIFARGASDISFEFITGQWDWGQVIAVLARGEEGSVGGISHYIIGSIIIVIACELVALPLGIGSAIYLSEYSSENKLTNIIRFFIETLAGVPSIIFGLLGYIIFVSIFGESIIAGGLALALMILPWNIRVTEEAMKAVPHAYREASYALGATKWQTIKNVVLYASSPGILTGILLGVGAAIGETAVLIYTTGAEEATTLPGVLYGGSEARVPTLAVWIWSVFNKLSVSNVPQWETENLALAGSVVLMVLFLGISIVALLIRNHLSKKIKGN